MDELRNAEEAVGTIAAQVVLRHRAAGVLTWALLHEIESEVLQEAIDSGEHSKTILNMLRAPAAMAYPKDGRAASFDGHSFMPIIFEAVVTAWHCVH